MPISSYATTAAGNNTGGALFPENMNANVVNDSARQMQADVRNWYEDAEWIKWGDTTTYVAGTQFKISGSDVTSRYSVGRRVRVVGSSTGTIYGKITTSSFSTDTTVTVSFDSGSMSNETLTVSIAAIKGGTSANSIDVTGIKNAAASGANTDITSVYLNNTGLKIKDTNASHGLSIVPGSNITADRTLTVTTGDADRTVTLSADLTVSATATLSGTNTGDVAAASQAEMEAASSNTVMVTPGRMKYHPGVISTAGRYNAISNTLVSSINVSSVSDDGAGVCTFNFSTSYSNTSYIWTLTVHDASGTPALDTRGSGTAATSSLQVKSWNSSNSLVDCAIVNLHIIGDFA